MLDSPFDRMSFEASQAPHQLLEIAGHVPVGWGPFTLDPSPFHSSLVAPSVLDLHAALQFYHPPPTFDEHCHFHSPSSEGSLRNHQNILGLLHQPRYPAVMQESHVYAPSQAMLTFNSPGIIAKGNFIQTQEYMEVTTYIRLLLAQTWRCLLLQNLQLNRNVPQKNQLPKILLLNDTEQWVTLNKS
ncbi:hypothetical protein K439DRAFT_1618943 [Ramaria rubella]|nr:hypothetical protein K439DRAFT_1618943 [Ramaria rubella]